MRFAAHLAIVMAIVLTCYNEDVAALQFCLQCPALQLPGCIPPGGLIPCGPDCATNHASAGGSCNGQNQCICTGEQPSETPACTYNLLGLPFPKLCQCAAENALFAGICDTDCKCNHGSEYGTCLYDKHQCKCESSAGFTWTQATCPFPQGYDVNAALLQATRQLGL